MLKRKKFQTGIALVYVLMMVLLFSTLIALTYQLTNRSISESGKELYVAQAVNTSRSGIQDAYGWFTRQANIVAKGGASCVAATSSTNQGIYSDMYFNPVERSTFSDIADTDDASIGIVRDILLDDQTNLFGHYEVRKQTINNECPLPAAAAKEDPLAVHDITHLKKVDVARGSGSVWRITSIGYVYLRGNRNFNSTTGIYTDACCENMSSTTKNIVLAKKILSAEFNRLNLTDTLAAISILAAGNVVSNDKRSIVAPGSAFGVKAKTGALSANTIFNIKGTNPLSLDGSLALTTIRIFGMTADILKGVSDYNSTSVTTSLTLNPDGSFRRHASKLIYIDGNATFTNVLPLKGTGILFVKGNLTFAANAQSFFSGVIYVENGDLTINSGNTISGGVIVAGSGKKLNLVSPSGDVATVEYNREIIDSVRKKLANYRLNRLSFKVVQ